VKENWVRLELGLEGKVWSFPFASCEFAEPG